MNTPTNFEEIEFALNNPDDGMMGDALAALEIVRAEFEAMQRAVQAAKDVFAWDRQKEPYLEVVARAEFDEAIAALAAVKSGVCEMNIKLTSRQLKILARHLSADVSHGVSGTFGDGDNFDDKREFNDAVKLSEKLNSILLTAVLTGGAK